MSVNPTERKPELSLSPSTLLDVTPSFTGDQVEVKQLTNKKTTHYHSVTAVNVEEFGEKSSVGVGKCGFTNNNIIYTGNLGPCQGVVAKLKNGNFALYHAASPDSSPTSFKDFVAQTKGDVAEIFVFQKPDNASNYAKAPILAVELAIALGVNVQRVEVPHYGAIICDAINHRVLVVQQHGFHCNRQGGVEGDGVKIDILGDSIDLQGHIARAIPVEQSKQEVLSRPGMLFAEARLAMAVSENNAELAKQVSAEISPLQLQSWLQTSQHSTNKQMVENFHALGLSLDRQPKKPSLVEKKPSAPASSWTSGITQLFRPSHIKSWQKDLLGAIQGGDTQLVSKKLARFEEEVLKKDKADILQKVLYPAAIQQYQREKQSSGQKICQLLERIAVKNGLNLAPSLPIHNVLISPVFTAAGESADLKETKSRSIKESATTTLKNPSASGSSSSSSSSIVSSFEPVIIPGLKTSAEAFSKPASIANLTSTVGFYSQRGKETEPGPAGNNPLPVLTLESNINRP